jgi:hypothetical protein
LGAEDSAEEDIAQADSGAEDSAEEDIAQADLGAEDSAEEDLAAQPGTVRVDLVAADLEAEEPGIAWADLGEISGAERVSAVACPAEQERAVRAPRGRVAAVWAAPVWADREAAREGAEPATGVLVLKAWVAIGPRARAVASSTAFWACPPMADYTTSARQARGAEAWASAAIWGSAAAGPAPARVVSAA